MGWSWRLVCVFVALLTAAAEGSGMEELSKIKRRKRDEPSKKKDNEKWDVDKKENDERHAGRGGAEITCEEF
jgi:hypothetical protein